MFFSSWGGGAELNTQLHDWREGIIRNVHQFPIIQSMKLYELAHCEILIL